MPATSPALERLSSTRGSRGGATGVIVRDGFVPGSLCEQLRTQMTQGCPELGAVESKTLEMPAAIPASLHARVMSVLQTGCVKDSEASPEVARALDQAQDFDAQATVDVPARVSAVGVQLHQDRYVGEASGLVTSLVVVVYLAGGGTMTFVDERTGHVHGQVDIVPGRLIAHLLLPQPHNATATLPDAATTAPGANECSCNAPAFSGN